MLQYHGVMVLQSVSHAGYQRHNSCQHCGTYIYYATWINPFILGGLLDMGHLDLLYFLQKCWHYLSMY